ncbi:hypothetical protein HYX14_05135 [Candidatus Woesearchaeota archaeon]|nr:hypothetical protein [Candidatus Woesearchaeota archaeon]
MSEVIEDHCGLAVTHTLHDLYSSLQSLQHRGREAAGIAAVSDQRIDVLKWVGKVNQFDFTLEDLHRIFPDTNYRTFLGHVRYATRGRKDKILEDAHPHTIGGTVIDRGDHVFVQDCLAAIVHNGQVNEEYLVAVDKSLLKTACDTEALLQKYLAGNEREIVQTIPGAYTAAIADKRRKEVMVFRDRTGIMPGVLGKKGGKYLAASEDIALRKNGAKMVEDLTPGSIYYFDQQGNFRKEKVINPQPAFCHFQYNYFADADSIMNGVSVRTVRQSLGRQCAEEFPFQNVDYVTYVPYCPEDAALTYAGELGLPFLPVFYKKNTERSFLGSTETERENSIGNNLHLFPHVLERIRGKVLLAIEDSTVRGNVARRVRHLLCDVAQVKEARILNYTPLLGIIGADGEPRGCRYGVDMPTEDNFIARVGGRNRTQDEISREVGLTMLYLSPRGEMEAFRKAGLSPENLCTFCVGGKKPF